MGEFVMRKPGPGFLARGYVIRTKNRAIYFDGLMPLPGAESGHLGSGICRKVVAMMRF